MKILHLLTALFFKCCTTKVVEDENLWYFYVIHVIIITKHDLSNSHIDVSWKALFIHRKWV